MCNRSKSFLPFAVVVLLTAIVAVVVIRVGKQQGNVTIQPGNLDREPIAMFADRFQCAQCAMTITAPEQASQAVDLQGRTWFFDDIGCLAVWSNARADAKDLKLWARAVDSGEWIDARQASYSRDAETIMNYGFAPYVQPAEGHVDFETVVRMMLRDENLNNPAVRRELLGTD